MESAAPEMQNAWLEPPRVEGWPSDIPVAATCIQQAQPL
jgi:hypothetical protein